MEAEDTSLIEENEILQSRVGDLEATVAVYKEQLRIAQEKDPKKRKYSSLSEAPSDLSSDKHGVYYGRSLYLGGPAAPDFLQRLMSLVPNEQSDMLFAFSGGSNNVDVPPEASIFTIPDFLPANYGKSEMLTMLRAMGRPLADERIQSFFDIVDVLFHYVPTPWIWQRYDRCFDLNEDPPAQEIALIFMVLALGDRASTNTESSILIGASMQLVRMSNCVRNPSLDAIHTFCYLAIYLQYEGRLSEYWPLLGLVIRLAQSMGLHRDPSYILNLPVEEAEIRRRLFWTISAQETALSVMFGRPNGIGFNDVAMPKDISDAELCGVDPDEDQSEPYVNEISYNRYTWQIGVITREIIEHGFQSEGDQISRIKDMETRIRTWHSNLPHVFKLDTSASIPSANSTNKDQYVQSLLLHIIVHHNILVLFRQPLSKSGSAFARKPCFEAAFAVIEGWKILQDNFPKMASVAWMQWFRAFHAGLICHEAVRWDNGLSEFHGRALASWKSCLQVFARIKTQNRSILGCWRALDRLDKVLQSQSHQRMRIKRRYSSKKPLRDSSQQLFIRRPSEGSDSAPPLPPIQEPAGLERTSPRSFLGSASSDPRATDPANEISIADDSPLSNNIPNFIDYMPTGQPGEMAPFDPNLGLWDMGLFDMNTQNWPSWLTNEQSPNFGM
jgi:hypothetical protein